jgi:predicted enzyme related to lactoylglutathione lyase
MLKGLETVVYFVEDVRAACAWYREALGVAPNHDTEHYAGFTVAGDELGLHPGKPGSGGQIAYWSVADIDAAIARLVARGAQGVKPPEDVGGGIRIGSVRDPFGNELGLIQNPRSPNR